MKLIVNNPEFGIITWEVPDDLAEMIDSPEKTIEATVERMRPIPGLELGKVPAFVKEAVIGIIQKEIGVFFSLLALAHRMAKTANPPSKYATILENGLVGIAQTMKRA